MHAWQDLVQSSIRQDSRVIAGSGGWHSLLILMVDNVFWMQGGWFDTNQITCYVLFDQENMGLAPHSYEARMPVCQPEFPIEAYFNIWQRLRGGPENVWESKDSLCGIDDITQWVWIGVYNYSTSTICPELKVLKGSFTFLPHSWFLQSQVTCEIWLAFALESQPSFHVFS